MSGPFRFIVMGDSSRCPEVMNEDVLSTHLSHIKQLSTSPKCIFFLGDMICGGYDLEKQLGDWKTLVQRFYPISMHYPVLGNHENDENIFSDVFSHLPLEQLSGYKRTVYYFDCECARFIILNSNRRDSNGGYVINSFQRAWLEKTLGESSKKYNFILLHVPAFPVGNHIGESLDKNVNERNVLWKILEHYNVTAVFCGHEHNYCRRIIENTPGKAIYHITSGGAGSQLNRRAASVCDAIIGPVAVYHFAVVDIYDDEVYLKVYDNDTALVDCCRLFPIDYESQTSPLLDILVPVNSLWRYLDDGSDQGTLWREPGFDDSFWKSGVAELGYGDGGEATIVSYGPDVHRKYITTYFRKAFSISKPSLYKNLTLRILRDDGAVVYINGEEVYRNNMPSGIIRHNTLASRSIDGDEETDYEKIKLDTTQLREGDNLIAVEIHQASISSSDISFNLQLLGHKKV